MVSIEKARIDNSSTIASIGLVSVEQAHRDSCSAVDLQDYLHKHYNEAAIKAELSDPRNNYHIIYADGVPAGFSKIVFDEPHPAIGEKHVAKLDRIYLLHQFQGLKLGLQLLQFNIDLAKSYGQSGIWLFTWIGNQKAIDFYMRAGFKIIGSHWFQVSESHSNLNHHMLLSL